MKRSSTPKLTPTFNLHIAHGLPLEPDFTTASSHLDIALHDIIGRLYAKLPRLVKGSPLFYGESGHDHTQIALILDSESALMKRAYELSSAYSLPIRTISCATPPAADDPTLEIHAIVLEDNQGDTGLQHQLKAVRNESLRAFSDILLWIGPLSAEAAGTSRADSFLIDCILDGKPVLHVPGDGQVRVLDYLLVDEPERLLLHSREMTGNHLDRLFRPYDERLINNDLQFIVNPSMNINRRSAKSAEKELYDYFSEKAPLHLTKLLAGRIDKVLQALICFKGLPWALFGGLPTPWYGVDIDINVIRDRQHPMEPEGLRERFGWSDTLANVYAGIRRDITWTLYLLSSLAVFAAVAGSLHGWPYLDWFWPTAELIAVLVILVLYGWATRRDLHGRWLFHRFLAEQIRYTRYGYPTLSFQMPLLAPLRLSTLNEQGLSQVRLASPESWILKRILVGVGQPKLNDATTFKPTEITAALKAYVRHVIDDQRRYHSKTWHTMHKMEHRLHALTKLGFIVTAIAVASHFYLHATWLLIFTAALPSLAAAVHGIVTTNEMGRVAALSKRTDQKLHHLQQSLKRLESAEEDDARSWLRLRDITHQSASVMSNVNQQWQELIQHHETSLPA